MNTQFVENMIAKCIFDTFEAQDKKKKHSAQKKVIFHEKIKRQLTTQKSLLSNVTNDQ